MIRLTNEISLSQARIASLEKDLSEVRASQESRSQQFRSAEFLYMQQIEDLRASLRQQEATARELESKVRLAEHERDEKSRFAEEQAKKEIQWIQEKNLLDSKI